VQVSRDRRRFEDAATLSFQNIRHFLRADTLGIYCRVFERRARTRRVANPPATINADRRTANPHPNVRNDGRPATMDVNRLGPAPHHYVRNDSGSFILSARKEHPATKDFYGIAGILPSNAREATAVSHWRRRKVGGQPSPSALNPRRTYPQARRPQCGDDHKSNERRFSLESYSGSEPGPVRQSLKRLPFPLGPKQLIGSVALTDAMVNAIALRNEVPRREGFGVTAVTLPPNARNDGGVLHRRRRKVGGFTSRTALNLRRLPQARRPPNAVMIVTQWTRVFRVGDRL